MRPRCFGSRRAPPHPRGALPRCRGKGATDEDAAEILASQLIKMMKATGIANDIGGVGYGEADSRRGPRVSGRNSAC